MYDYIYKYSIFNSSIYAVHDVHLGNNACAIIENKYNCKKEKKNKIKQEKVK